MQRAQRLRQAHHPLRQLRRQQLGNGAGVEQIQRLIGQLTQRSLLDAFGSGVDRRQGLLHLRGAEIALNAVLGVDHLRAVLAALRLAVGQHAAAWREAVFHRRVEVEKAHRQNAAAVADLAGHHPAAAEGNVAVEHFALDRGVDARQQIGNRVEMGAVFIAQGQVQEQILDVHQADFSQLAALRRANAG